MSSLFHEAEVQLAKIALAMLEGNHLNVVVGGLGLGYTAVAALEDQRISSLMVIEYLDRVIEWHQEGMVPNGKTLTQDPRCEFRSADFFKLSESLDQHDAILLDIDHRPDFVLNTANKDFYTQKGLSELATHLKPGGVFAMWADGLPQNEFTNLLQQVFKMAKAHTIEFANPIRGGVSHGTVYVAK